MLNLKKEQALVHLITRFVLLVLGASLIEGCGNEPVLNRMVTSLNDFYAKYEGMDKGKSCSVIVHREWKENSSESKSVYRVEVSTSYEHQGQGLGKVILTFAPTGQGKILEWTNPQNGEFLRIQLSAASDTLLDPVAFRIKWIHFDHLHDATCSQLKKVENL
ncbi:MAG: hypothetical protein EB078_12130 [Proteobacteria bacterium]|nr:hypothetical protein [Pseudomonadota bacterium]NDC25813.1 hypothetical protein [Pseudomonadota bacterium]NDD05647.1 hypothetical protein [Pseudomonadota bacterium]NDG26390.1 hypothetical protein [Pseudomonadota bacterium]